MKTIYKFILDSNIFNKPQIVELYDDSSVLDVQNQDGHITGWMLCDTSKPKSAHRFLLAFTGYPIDYDPNEDRYIGTVQLDGLVYHVIHKDVYMDY